MLEKYKVIGFVIVLLHLVGASGILIPETRELMITLTPWNLLLSAFLLVFAHEGSTKKLILFFLIAFTIGYSTEVLGVHTGFPFGDYSYGETLGLKVLGVPLIIGVNWFLLSYSFGILASRITNQKLTAVLIASLGMVFLDLLIEPVAISLDYWSWEGKIPVGNYAGWFVTSGIIQIFFVNFRVIRTNKLVIPLLCGQILFFGQIIIFNLIFKTL